MKTGIVASLVGLVVAGLATSAPAAFVNPFQVDPAFVSTPGPATPVNNWSLSSVGGTATVDRSPPPGFPLLDANSVNLTAYPGVLASLIFTVPVDPNPSITGYLVTFATLTQQDHPTDFAQYSVNGGAPVSVYTGPAPALPLPQFRSYTSPTIFLGIAQTLEFDIYSAPGANNTLNIQLAEVTPVPEPATMALNGLVLIGATAGWAWNRRRKAA